MMKNLLITFLFLFIFAPIKMSAHTAVHKWSVNEPFQQNLFIENKGQFDGDAKTFQVSKTWKVLPDSPILYGASYKGVDMYFTASGVSFRHSEVVHISEEEHEKMEHRGARHTNTSQRGETEPVQVTNYSLNIQWLGANPNVNIVAMNKAKNYFTYGDLKDKTGKSTLRANGFSKIIYQNIYPNIDVEYIFPEGKEGIKYTLVLHPGADSHKIQMQYDGAKELMVDPEGNLRIESAFGEFVDHTPVTFYDGNHNIKSSFSVNNNIVSFHLEND